MSGTRIGLRQVNALQPGQTIWDTAVAGFGARRQKSAAVAYVLAFRRGDGKQRWHTIGRHGSPWTPDSARIEARRLLGIVATGGDPAADKALAKRAQTVSDLLDAYVAEMQAGRLLTRRRASKSPATIATDLGRIERHIRPLIGDCKIADVSRRDVERFMHDVAAGKTAARIKTAKRGGVANVRGGNGTAARTVGLLGAIFSFAERQGLRTGNPVRGVIRPADGRRERRLKPAEYALLGKAMTEAVIWPPAVAAIKFLLLTGWRRGEVIGLRWEHVDLEARTVLLPQTKTGRSLRPLSAAAADVLKRQAGSNGFVFVASRSDGVEMAGLPKFFLRLRTQAGLPADITPHVFRHSYASLASDSGLSEATIGALIGHASHTVTSRYVHSADAVLLSAADKVADAIEMLLVPS